MAFLLAARPGFPNQQGFDLLDQAIDLLLYCQTGMMLFAQPG